MKKPVDRECKTHDEARTISGPYLSGCSETLGLPRVHCFPGRDWSSLTHEQPNPDRWQRVG
jgi:hypothetical protein